jgi:peptidoglycan/LPS O-acetylase OafA/YrhL
MAVVGLAVIGRTVGFHWWILLARCDGFALGGLLAASFRNQEEGETCALPSPVLFLAAIGLAMAVLALGVSRFGARSFLMPPVGPRWPGLTILAINLGFFGIVGLVLRGSSGPAFGLLRMRSLRYLGQISYGLYLYHLIVFWLVDCFAQSFGLPRSRLLDAAKLCGSLAAAHLSWSYIEQPLLALKSHFPYRPAYTLVSVPAAHGGPARQPVRVTEAATTSRRGHAPGRE